jgi:DNA-binding response OmpR family regulator
VLVRHALADYLRECGYRVLEAASTTEARVLIGERSSDIHIVLVEADAEGESGFALAAWLRRNHAGIDVILSGSVAALAEQAGDLCEDGPRVQKPYDHQLLLKQIRRLQAARDRAE